MPSKQDPPENQAMVATGDGNADDPYVGVDPIYKNHANDTEKPFVGEGDEGDLEEAAREREEEALEAAKAGAQGIHPSEGAKPEEKPKRAAPREPAAAKTE